MKHKLNRLTSALLVLVMVLGMFAMPAAAAHTYTDVPSDAWYKGAVDYVTEKEIMNGVTEDTFEPGAVVTRAMFVTVLARLAKAETDDSVSPFADVPAGQWYTGAVAWAAEHGIVNGVGDNLFAPNNSITRQDMCTVLARFVNAMGYELPQDQTVTFKDIRQVSSYAREAVKFCAAAGLVAGYDDGRFVPKGTTIRAEIATVMMRFDMLLDGQIVEPIPMPAQSFDGTAGEDMTVSVNAPEGALPENTDMTVSRVTDEAALAAIAEQINGQVYAAADITFTKDGAELEPEKAVEVQIALDGLENLKNPTVYHVNADGSVDYVVAEVVSATRGSEKVLRFYASEFSVYAIGDNGSTVNTLTVNFYDKAGEIVSSQVIRLDQLDQYIAKNMDFVHDPGVPTITDTQSFEGWADKQAYTEEDTGYSVADINEKIKTEKAALAAATGDQTWNYYAKVYEVVFVTFHDQDGVVIRLESIHLDNGHGDYEVNLSYTPFQGGWAHIGWTPTINNTGDTPTYPDSPVVYENGDTIDLTASIDLYPYLKQGYWLMFDNYIEQDNDATSASFTSPRYYGKDESAALPTDYGDANNDGVDHDAEPYRVGYTFGGWYTDKNFTTAYTARQLTADTTVYAKWTPRTDTPYMVVIWTQRADDPVDSNDLNNNYDFYKAIETRKGTTGATANFLTADTTLGGATGSELGYYFTYNQAASDTAGKTIKGDGTTVLNVYYNRRTITINFWTSSSMSTLWTGGGNVYVPAENGSYYYYTAPYETGYYLCGTGPNTSMHPNTGNSSSVSGYYWGSTYYTSSTYSSAEPDNPTNDANAYGSNETTQVVKSNSTGYYYDAYNSSHYYPIYYSYTAPYASGYYQVGTGPDTTAAGTHNLQAFQNPMVGLYQAPLTNWPSDPATGYEWAYDDAEDNKHYGITVRDCYDIPDNTHTTVWNIYAEAKDYTAYKTIHWMCEDLDGSFAEKTTTQLGYSSSKSQTQYYDDGKFLGFKAYGHNLSANSTETSGGFVAYTSGAGISTNDAGQNAYIYFTRMAYDLSYMSQGHTVKTQSGVKYQQPLADFAAYEPTNGPAGYYFDGWYKDPGCTEEFDWTDDMPNNNVAVYAKWTKMRFRVTLDYTGGDSSAQVTFPANQASTFRVDYGEKVRDTAIIAATREGYTLLGWYLDPQGNHPFNFAEAITDQTYNMDLTYKDAPDSERVGTDAVTGVNWTDVGRTNMVGKVTIYALWRQNPIGSDGVRVRYDAIEGDGYFPVDGQKTDPRVIIRDDPNVYTDAAKAFAQVASTPEDDENYRFLYWVVMQPVKDAQGNVVMENGEPKLEPTTIKVYPGQTFTVDYDYTVQVEAVKVKWIFKDADGDEDLIDTTTVTKGAVPTHSKPSGYVSGSYYYPVVGWKTDDTHIYYYDSENHTGTNVELPAVSKNTTFTAVYGEPEAVSQHQFTVTWKNWDGTVLKTEQLTAGTTPSYTGAAPTRPDDSDYTYTFSGWTPAITVVSGDVTYTATYTTAEKTYTVTFHANGGAFGSTDSMTVSNVAKETLFRDIFPTTDPTHSSYTFLGWFTAATGGTEVTATTEFDGTVLDLYAHYYAYYVYQDTSGTFIDGEVYVFRFTLGSTNYYLNATSSTGRLNGTNTSPIPVTAQWTAHASSSTGFYFENLNYSGSYIYDYTSNTDYAALSTTNYWRMLLEAGSTSGTFYFYTPGNSNDYYMYYGSSSYSGTRYFQWSTSNATAFTVMHREKRDMNADSGTGGVGSTGTMAVVSPESPAVVQRAIFGEVKSEPNAPAASATRGNTQPVNATTDTYYAPVSEIETGVEYLIGYKDGNTVYLLMNYNPNTSSSYATVTVGSTSGVWVSYGIPAVTDSAGNVTGIDSSTITNATISNVEWKFVSSDNGYIIQNAGDSSYHLKLYNYNAVDLYAGTTNTYYDSWNWNNGRLSLTANNYGTIYAHYVSMISSSSSGSRYFYAPTSAVETSNLQLYKKTENTTPTYNITWNYKASDGTDASVTNPVEENTLPTAPTVPETYTLNGTTYTFTGWTPAIVAATEATTYTAQYSVQSYTITWSYKDSTGADTSTTTTVAPGATPEPGFTPASYTSGGDEYRFTGWSPAIVAATGPATYTAQYTSNAYTITWHTKVDGGTWTTTTTTVAEGQVPSYNSHPIWTDGNGDDWMFSAWNSAEDGTGTAPVAATADADYWAQYTKVGVYTYTMYLHAVYGLYNKSGTHVTWFGNNDPTEATAGVQIERDKGMQINIGYPIPKPDAFVNGVKDYAGDSTQSNPTTTTLTYEDHVFLGWARLEADADDTANAGSAHPDLTENDLYLKWDAASGKYRLNTNAGNAGDPVWSEPIYTNIAADEMTPYHDMYAVWAGYAYVFHSATGKLEAIEVKRSATVDLVSKVTDGYLYGGYYTTYGGAKDITTEAMRGYKDSALSKRNDTDKMVSTSAVTYDGSTVKNGDTRFWTKANAYGYGNQASAPAGDNLVPTVGTVYYLKEVPETYLTTKYLYTYETLETAENVGQIVDFFMITVLDDSYYNNVGFRTKDGAETVTAAATADITPRTAIAGSFSIVQKGNGIAGHEREFDQTVTVNPASFGLSRGYVAVTVGTDWLNQEVGKSFTVMPAWETLDGVEVNSHGTLKLIVNAEKTTITYQCLGILASNKLYVNVDNVKSWWYNDNAVTKLYFFNDTEHTWVTPTAVEGEDDLFECEYPAGSWTHVIVTRSAGGDDWANQTFNIPLDRSKNRIWVKPQNGSTECEYYYDNYNP